MDMEVLMMTNGFQVPRSRELKSRKALDLVELHVRTTFAKPFL
jgi:hypothetical protein